MTHVPVNQGKRRNGAVMDKVKSPIDGYFTRKNIDICEAEKLYKKGRTLEDIGSLYGVSNTTISRRFKENGIKTRNRSEAVGFGSKNHSWKVINLAK